MYLVGYRIGLLFTTPLAASAISSGAFMGGNIGRNARQAPDRRRAGELKAGDLVTVVHPAQKLFRNRWVTASY